MMAIQTFLGLRPALGIVLSLLLLGMGNPIKAEEKSGAELTTQGEILSKPGLPIPLLLAPVMVHPDSSKELGEALEAALLQGAREMVSAQSATSRIHLTSAQRRRCFDERCARALSEESGAESILLARLQPGDTADILKVVRYLPGDGTVLATKVQIPKKRNAGSKTLQGDDDLEKESQGRLHLARMAARALLSQEGDLDRGTWESISWLSNREHQNEYKTLRYAAGTALLATGVFALAQGQFLGESVSGDPPTSEPLKGKASGIKGFFGSVRLDARREAMGGIGDVTGGDGLSVLANPALLTDIQGKGVQVSKGATPDGAPRLLLGYGSPLIGPWYQGYALSYEGDGLASEALALGGLAYDFSDWGTFFENVRAGLAFKIAMAQVGEDGFGQDHAQGHSLGAGMDLGFCAPVSSHLDASLVLHDAIGFLWHRNHLTDVNSTEWPLPELRAAAGFTPKAGLLLMAQGRKGVFAGQPDIIQVGGEGEMMRFLRVRAGYRQVFGEETARFLTLGFGLSASSFLHRPAVGIDYAYVRGLNDHAYLGGGVVFSLNAAF